MLSAAVITLLAAAPVPPECEQPELRDVLQLKQLAQLDGALSVGLDSVATWCFDPGGSWTGGLLPQPGKGKVKAAKNAPPTGDCAKAVASCEASLKAADKEPLRQLAAMALRDLDREYRGLKYAAKRSGLKDKPNEKADCQSRERSELFGQAQARMDLARLTSQIQSEYANYKSWLVQESMRCRSDVATAKRTGKDNTRVAVENTPKPEPAPVVAKAEPPPKPEPAPKAEPPPKITATTTAITSTEAAAVKAEPPPASWVTERETALARPMLEKWKYLADQTARQETDRDYTLGFLASREIRACDCTRVNPGAIVRSIEKREGGATGQSLLQSEDGTNTRCTVCALDAFTAWKPRIEKQCKQMDQLTDYELDKLSQSDDANGIPPRCMEETKTRRAEAKRVEDEKKRKADEEAARVRASMVAKPTPPSILDAGTVAMAVKPQTPVLTPLPPPPQPAQPTQPTPTPNAAPSPTAQATPPPTAPGANPNLVTVNGMTYYRPAAPSDGSAAAAPPPTTAAVGGPAPSIAAPPQPHQPVQPPPPANDAHTVNVPQNAPTTGPGAPVASAAPVDNFVPPEAWAPIPVREDGRMYVRLSMSAACTAEITPGPIQARTGDLLLVPYGARQLAVKSPCGGLAEIYWGKEAKPRFSEVFGRNQAIKFEFKNP